MIADRSTCIDHGDLINDRCSPSMTKYKNGSSDNRTSIDRSKVLQPLIESPALVMAIRFDHGNPVGD